MNTKLLGEDAACLHLEGPKQPMIVTALLELEDVLPIERVHGVLRLLTTYPRFSSRLVDPVLHVGTPSWKPVPEVDVADHVEHVDIGAGEAEVRRFLEGITSVSLDPKRPLWRVFVVDRPGRGSLVVFRIHHAIADGYALLEVLRELAEAAPAPPRETPPPPSAWESARRTASAVERAMMVPADPMTTLRARPTGVPRIAWSAPVALAEVERIAEIDAASVNDVLVATLAGALRRYLGRRGQLGRGTELHALVPMDLRAPDARMELANHFGVATLALPVGIEDPLSRLVAVKRREAVVADGAEAKLTHGLLSVLGHGPKAVDDVVLRRFGRRSSLLVVSQLGPTERATFGGVSVARMMFWPPETATIGLAVSFFGYAGEVTMGVVSDAAVVPDPDVLVGDFHAELAAMDAARRARVA